MCKVPKKPHLNPFPRAGLDSLVTDTAASSKRSLFIAVFKEWYSSGTSGYKEAKIIYFGFINSGIGVINSKLLFIESKKL
jgi:hypothetical protein